MTQSMDTVIKQNLQEEVKENAKLSILCGRSKTALTTVSMESSPLDLSPLRGIVAYDPSEYTITAYAGTPLLEIQQILEENGQYLPFDPPLDQRGASLGGATAAGLNGPGSYRYGGMRDFLLASEFIDGTGSLVRGGARVVKNAAGFDTPKLLIGSFGQFGALVEITFKVFPKPEKFASVHRFFETLEEALEIHSKFYNNPLEVESIILSSIKNGFQLSTRIGGRHSTILKRAESLLKFVGGKDIIYNEEDEVYWDEERNFNWLPDQWALVKVPLTPSKIAPFEENLCLEFLPHQAHRRYSNGGQQAWVGLPDEPATLTTLSKILNNNDLSGIKILGDSKMVRLGRQDKNAFHIRVKRALDPQSRFVEV